MTSCASVLRSFAAIAAAITSACAWANPAHQQLQAMPEGQRAAFFARYLSGEGERCPAVTRAVYQGSDRRGASFWSVQCRGAAAWQLMINNDAGGSTKYLDCSVLRALNAGECFKRFKSGS